MPRKTELQSCVERLEIMHNVLSIKEKSGQWPTRKEWRALIAIGKKVVDEYHKANDSNGKK